MWPRVFCGWLGVMVSMAATSDFTFAILGDRTGETVEGVYQQIWKEIDASRPDFVINVGDTIQGLNDATAESEWRRVRPIWTRYKYPFYLVPGNHDIWSGASQAIFEKQAGRPPAYAFDHGRAHFTVLDNSRSLQLSSAQMLFLEKDLEASKGQPLKFVVFHQPFWLLPLKLQSTDFAFHRLMLRYRVQYVICGHVHQFSRMEREGIVYMVVGSSGGHLRGHDPLKDFAQGWFYQHVEVRVSGSRVEMVVKEAGPPFGKGRRVKVEDWGENGLGLVKGAA